MRKNLFITIPALAMATPAMAAQGAFFSLKNTDFVVTIGFLLFIGVLLYFRIPGIVGRLLDKRAESIRAELEEARKLREEAQSILASYERKLKEVKDQATKIIEAAQEEAELAAKEAKEALKETIARRMQAAEEQIASARASAVREVRDQAATVAVNAARDVLASQIDATKANKLIEEGIEEAAAKLH